MAPVGSVFLPVKKPEGEDTRRRVTLNKEISYADAAKRGLAPAPLPLRSPEEKAKRKREARKRRTPAQLVANLAKNPAAVEDLKERTAIEQFQLEQLKVEQQLRKRRLGPMPRSVLPSLGPRHPFAPKASQVGESQPPPPLTPEELSTLRTGRVGPELSEAKRRRREIEMHSARATAARLYPPRSTPKMPHEIQGEKQLDAASAEARALKRRK